MDPVFVPLKGQSDAFRNAPARNFNLLINKLTAFYTYFEEPDLAGGTYLLRKWDFALRFMLDGVVPGSLRQDS